MGLINEFDTVIRHWVLGMRSEWLTSLMLAITSLGYTVQMVGIVAVIVLVLVHFKKYFEAGGLVGGVLGAHFLTEGLKRLVGRARPPLPWLGPATGYSFPSGHSLISMVLFGFLVYLVAINIIPSGWRRVLVAGLAVFPLLIGISRIYLGVHYPSDVLSGWILALVWLGIWIGAMNFARKKWMQKQQSGGDGEKAKD